MTLDARNGGESRREIMMRYTISKPIWQTIREWHSDAEITRLPRIRGTCEGLLGVPTVIPACGERHKNALRFTKLDYNKG